MHLSELDFVLPPELIAQNPAEPRDSAKLLVYDRARDTIRHTWVRDLASFLPKKTLLVANNSRVRQARLLAKNEAGHSLELLILEQIEGNEYRCLVGGSVKVGARLSVWDQQKNTSSPLFAEVRAREDLPGMNTYQIDFQLDRSEDQDLEQWFERLGEVPLPPYITHSSAQPERYQTVFAKDLGSAAAPTAGLHFTPQLIEQLQQMGHEWQEVTLHVGLGTFLPLRNQEIEKNHLHHESAFISPETAAAVNQAKARGRSLLAIGTTSTRTLESHARAGQVEPGMISTDLFIYPGYQFQLVDLLLTNFHLPHSSLLLLVAAFLGNHPDKPMTTEEMLARLHHIYEIAIEEHYRFFSFGDAMLIL